MCSYVFPWIRFQETGIKHISDVRLGGNDCLGVCFKMLILYLSYVVAMYIL